MMHAKAAKLIATVLLAALMAATVVVADDNINEKGEAGQPGSWLYYGASVRSLALGGAYVAAADDAGSIFYNPAGLMREYRAWDIYGMHANPFYASRYNAFAVVWSRPEAYQNGAGGFLLGANSALGFGFIETRSGDFQHRSASDQLMDDSIFSIYHQAAFLTWASRWAGTMGIADAGIGLKVIRQGLDGLEGYGSHTGAGLDFGLQMQLIHPRPASDLVPLRHLLPLRLGMVFQNILGPRAGFGKTSEKYPFTIRWGGSYLAHVTDKDRILALADATHTYWKHVITGWHIGAEYQRRVSQLQVMPRAGINREYGTTKFTAGFGLAYSISGYDLQFDFSPGFGRLYSELDNDLRFSLRVTAGAGRTAKYFHDKANESASNAELARWWELQALGCYPTPDGRNALANDTSSLYSAVVGLAEQWDTKNPVRVRRYNEFLGGSRQASHLIREALADLRAGHRKDAGSKATEALALDIFSTEACPTGLAVTKAEAHLIVAETDSAAAPDQAEEARKLLQSASSDSAEYLLGRSFWHRKEWDSAVIQYSRVLSSKTAGSDLKAMSILGMAQCFADSGATVSSPSVDSLVKLLTAVTADSTKHLSAMYLPFPGYPDMTLADDAQYLLGCVYEKTKDTTKAMRAYAAVCQLFPGLDRCTGKWPWLPNGENKVDSLLEKQNKTKANQ